MGAGWKALSLKPGQREALLVIAAGALPSACQYTVRSLSRLGLITRARRSKPWQVTPEGLEVAFKLGYRR